MKDKTIIYLSTDTAKLKSLNLNIYFPETELHPRHIWNLVPSLLGKSLCTHSATIVNRIGHMIADKLINCNSVEVYLIEYDDIKEEWYTTKSTFDEEGYLLNWSLEFFEGQLFN